MAAFSENDLEVFTENLVKKFHFDLGDKDTLKLTEGRKYRTPTLLLSTLYKNSTTKTGFLSCLDGRDNLKDAKEQGEDNILLLCEEAGGFLLRKIKERKSKETRQAREMGRNIEERTGVRSVTNSVNPKNYVVAVNRKDDEILLLYSQTLNPVEDMCYDFFRRVVGQKKAKELEEQARPCMIEYNPFSTEPGWKEQDTVGQEFWVVNSYHPPAWRLEKTPENPEIPKLFRKLLIHLFPQPEARKFVLSWMHHALFNRCETMLCLNGEKGCGKGVFTKVLRHLVGPQHYEEIKDSAFDQFNSQLENKRVIVADEVRIDKRRHTALKKFANNLVPIEAKGQDTKTSQVYYSWIITNNDSDDLYLETDDRRFSVVRVNQKPLIKVGTNRETGMTQKEIDELIKEVEKEDSEFLVHLGNSILQYDRETLETYHEKYAWIDDKFFELCFNSLANWQQFVINALSGRIDSLTETLKEERGLNINVLRRAYDKEAQRSSKIPSNIEKIKDLRKKFHFNGKVRVFDVDKDSTGQYFLSPTEEYSSMIGLEFESREAADFEDDISLDDL